MNKHIRHKGYIVSTDGIRSVAIEESTVVVRWEPDNRGLVYPFDTDIAANDFFNLLGEALISLQPIITYSKM